MAARRREILRAVRLTGYWRPAKTGALPRERAMMTFLVVLSLIVGTAVLGAVSGGGTALAAVLFIAGIAAGVALSAADEDSIASPSA